MGGEAGDDADQHGIRVQIEAELLLKSRLVHRLAGEVLLRKSVFDRRVVLRIVGVVIDAVENPGEFVFPLAQKTVEPAGEPRVENLLGIGRADRADRVALVDAAFHEVAAAVPLDDKAVLLRQAENVVRDLHTEAALILDVVDGKERANILIALAAAVKDVIKNGDRSGLPIVAVEDVRREIHVRDRLEHRHGEERKPFRVVAVAIDAGTPEIIFVVEEIKNDAVVFCREEAAVLVSPSEPNPEIRQKRDQLPEFRRNIRIERHDDPAVLAGFTETFRQRICHVGKTACRKKRSGFAHSEQNLHRRPPVCFFSQIGRMFGQMTVPFGI